MITTDKILPQTNGARIATMGLLRYLKKLGYGTTLVSFFNGVPYSDSENEILVDVVDNCFLVEHKMPNVALNFSLRFPNNIRKYTRNSMKKTIKNICKESIFDIVIIDHLQMFEYASLFPNNRVLLHTHNVESKIWKEYTERCKWPISLLVNRSARMTYEYEKYALGKATAVLAICETDKKIFETMNSQAEILEFRPYNKVEIVKSDDDIRKSSKKILFMGSYTWYPNQTAALFLIEKIMPMLRKRINGVKLILVGHHPTELMLEAAEKWDDIIVTGLVDSVDPYIKEADVFVNPIIDGSGINIKTIEAMGKRIPIVASRYGVRGISLVEGESVFLYDNENECVDKIVFAINNREKCLDIVDSARKYYEQFTEPSEDVRRVIYGNEK